MSPGTLYLCATPIGNLGDITLRALETLKSVDAIACEDTRRTKKLLTHFAISKPLVSYHEHNRAQMGPVLAGRLLEGQSIALVTDAGTPGISDPGEDLVRLCIQNGIPVVPLPGAAAFVQALIMSGLPTRRFVFEGFLPVPKKEREERLRALAVEPRTILLYEAPHRLCRTLSDLLDTLGNRELALCRELTKLHEECDRTTIEGALERYAGSQPKGEFVLVITGAAPSVPVPEELPPVKEQVDAFIASGLSKKEAVRQTALLRGQPKREVYNAYERS